MSALTGESRLLLAASFEEQIFTHSTLNCGAKGLKLTSVIALYTVNNIVTLYYMPNMVGRMPIKNAAVFLCMYCGGPHRTAVTKTLFN